MHFQSFHYFLGNFLLNIENIIHHTLHRVLPEKVARLDIK